MILGVGVGWLEEEFDALGVPFADRGRRHDDYVEAMRALWTAGQGDGAQHVRVASTNCISRPRPTNGTVPIVVGGHTKAAARRAARLGDGFFPGSGSLDELRSCVRHDAAASARRTGATRPRSSSPPAEAGAAFDDVCAADRAARRARRRRA